MKFLAIFVTLLVVVAVVHGQDSGRSKNTNQNVIVIGQNKGAAPAAAPADGGLADAPPQAGK
ncbi:accessory gland-specific peptide 57Da [Drosophila biarmipes]|uniref:accessory gland-specific peptide 57Da n=1 Tax=Drosophila biarmipes TaxID=125945 RepID=UPI0007E7D7F0|nr:accessory gland-specific peptide 57Da [Drosophila biarmipes]